MQGLEQSQAMTRLGLRQTFNPKRCSLHFQLNVANPEHAEVAKKLVDMAQKVLLSSPHASSTPQQQSTDVCLVTVSLKCHRHRWVSEVDTRCDI